MKRLRLFTLVLLCTFARVMAQPLQGASLRFDETTFDFGTIAEADGPVSHSFRFVNSSTSAVLIEEVVNPCGCTTLSYPRAPIAAGAAGDVVVTFDPRGRTDSFIKRFRVVCNGGRSINTLSIRGRVKTDERADEKCRYALSAALSVERKTLVFPLIHHQDAPIRQQLLICNRSDKTVRLAYGFLHKSGCLQVKMPSTLAAHATTQVEVTLSAKAGFYGTVPDLLVLLVDGKQCEPITVFATVVDANRGVRADEAPRMTLSDTYYNLAKTAPGCIISRTVEVRNVGKTPLAIRKVECPASVSTDFCSERILNPNEHLALRISFQTPAANGSFEVRLKVITNDYANPIGSILFEGEVVGKH